MVSAQLKDVHLKGLTETTWRPLVGFPAPRHTVGGRVWNGSGELAFPGRQRESAQTVINY